MKNPANKMEQLFSSETQRLGVDKKRGLADTDKILEEYQ
jgi:hypothetical protein